MRAVLRATLGPEAPELQEEAQHAVLVGVGQRARQALKEGPGAKSLNGEPNCSSQ